MSEVKVQGEVSQTLFEYLHMEILSHLIESYGNEKKGEVISALEALGSRVGESMMERVSKDVPRFRTELDAMIFLCKQFWTHIFNKQVDHLKTNNQDMFVLYDNNFRLLMHLSESSQHQDKSPLFLAFTSGLITGALSNLGIKSRVTYEVPKMPQFSGISVESICTEQTSCSKCIQTSSLCSWCAQPDFSGSRCYPSTSNISCTDAQNPHGSVTETSNDSFTGLNQVVPQNVDISLRQGEAVKFSLSVQPAMNYPLDLYLLMDLSSSMSDDLSNVQALASDIVNGYSKHYNIIMVESYEYSSNVAAAVKNITTNYQLGFGAFVDKVVAPYVDARPDKLNEPCSGCESPFSFKHVISLTNNSQEFNNTIQNVNISGNLDSPEGGFDGVLQAIVCTNLVGWRPNARHILLYISDAEFHYAGDGKLGGVIVPHTGECFTGPQLGTNPVEYEEYNRLDYPSIGQIRQKLKEFDITLVFAVTQGTALFYLSLAQELDNTRVEQLATDSSNIIRLIEESYIEISQRVIVVPEDVENIAVVVTPLNCPQIDSDGNCDGVQIGERVDFDISMTLLQCSDEILIGMQLISIKVLGFGTVNIQLTGICNCDCETESVENSVECTNGNGTLICGLCECLIGRFGEFCQCDDTGQIVNAEIASCSIAPNGLECAGRGVCVCGKCECQRFTDGRTFFGEACECDNIQCDRDPVTGLICGGSDRGICTCNAQCECLISPLTGQQYTGSSCECSSNGDCDVIGGLSDGGLVGLMIPGNIDTVQPIIRTVQSLDQYSYFGFSLVIHRIDENATNFTQYIQGTRIIVSAPNGTAINATVTNTGVLFSCPVEQGSCIPLTGNGTGHDRRLYDVDANAVGQSLRDSEGKQNQFLGVSMDSKENMFIVCAHRYIQQGASGESQRPLGRCFYTENRELEGFQEFFPCDGRGILTSSFRVCQAGTSASLADDGNGNISISVGAPGTFTWRGILIRKSFGEVDLMDIGEGTTLFGWQGYSQTSGHIISLDREDFVVSVPRRDNYFGTVNVVTNTPALDIINENQLRGLQMGEYYGFSLVTVDLTGDGYDELIVGAPMYSTSTNPEVGRVYVYRNTGGSLSFFQHLTAPSSLQYVRFGHSIANLGDINGDGFEDIAIGAPFGNGPGTVYIYHGSNVDVISSSPQQIIVGSDITESLSGVESPKGFGYSLASSIDVDGNGLNDLAIGAYESQQVFLLRTRSVVQISLSLSSNNSVVDLDEKECQLDDIYYSCFIITTCATYPDENTLSDQIDLQFSLFGDHRNVEIGLEQRIFFNNSERTNTQTLTRTFNRGEELCINETVYVKNNIIDSVNGFVIEVTVKGPDVDIGSNDGNPNPSDFTKFPVVVTTGDTQIMVETFKKCIDTVCVPDLRIEFINITYETLSGDSPNSLVVGSVTNLNIWLAISNVGDDAFLSQLLFITPNPQFQFIRIEPTSLFIVCLSETSINETVLKCPVANPLSDDQMLTIAVCLSPTSSIIGIEGSFNLTFTVSSMNIENNTALYDNIVTVQIDVSAINMTQAGNTTTSSMNMTGSGDDDNDSNVTGSGDHERNTTSSMNMTGSGDNEGNTTSSMNMTGSGDHERNTTSSMNMTGSGDNEGNTTSSMNMTGSGDDNESNMTGSGDDNESNMTGSGDDNESNMTGSGDDNESNMTGSGDDNESNMTGSGDDNESNMTGSGDDNESNMTGSGDHERNTTSSMNMTGNGDNEGNTTSSMNMTSSGDNITTPINNGCRSDTTDIPSHSGNPNLTIVIMWPEINIGELAEVDCPCGNVTSQKGSLIGTRYCGGDFTNESQWRNPNVASCNFSDLAREICQLVELKTAERLQQLDDLTENGNDLGSTEVIVSVAVLLTTTEEVPGNLSLTNKFFDVVDNILDVNMETLLESQVSSNTSAKMLEAIVFVSEDVPIGNPSEPVVITRSAFAVSVQQVDIDQFIEIGQTFSANLGNSSDVNLDENIDSNDLSFDMRTSQSTASLTLPNILFSAISNNTRITHAVFLSDSLFLRRKNNDMEVGGIVISASVVGSDSIDGLNPPVTISFLKNPFINGLNPQCSFWDPMLDDGYGNWSSEGCEIDENYNDTQDEVTCFCDHLTSFSILLDVSPKIEPTEDSPLAHVLGAVTYIGLIVSIVCLCITIISYLSSKKLRSSEHGQLLINLCFALMGLYITFIFAIHSTRVTGLCALTAALLQYFFLVTFMLMASEAINLYTKLVVVLGTKINHFVLKATLISWLIPFFIVLFCFAPNYKNYVSDHFCRAFNLPYYIGMVVPVLIIYIFNWTIFFIIIVSLLHKSCKSDVKKKVSFICQQLVIVIALSIIFGLGWGIGLFATQDIHNNKIVRDSLAALFVIVTAFHGLFIFIMRCLRSKDVRNVWKQCFYGAIGKECSEFTVSYGSTSHTTRTGETLTLEKSQQDTEEQISHEDTPKIIESSFMQITVIENNEENKMERNVLTEEANMVESSRAEGEKDGEK